MDFPEENKAELPEENKAWQSAENKTKQSKLVKIRINQGRAIAGVGKAGDVVEVSELVAKNFIGQGLAIIIKE